MQNLENIVRKDFFENIKDLVKKARIKTYSAINFLMVETYWSIGKNIIEEEQQWKERAEYGKYLVSELSKKLTDEFGKWFSEQGLRNMRQFFVTFPILSTLWRELTRSQYKILMRIENPDARNYYIKETIEWHRSVRELERQIHTFTFERILTNKENAIVKNTQTDNFELQPKDILKDPYIFEFTGIEPNSDYYETDLEKSLISNIEKFLLEMGKWFTFYARQKHIKTETSDFFIDLVFYNFHLKCFLIIDLKTTKITHQDIWQIDMYVRMFDDLIKPKEDNPTIGLVLCAEKDETIIKYSVLNDNKNLFASKYSLYLPTEEELRYQIEKQKEIIKRLK